MNKLYLMFQVQPVPVLLDVWPCSLRQTFISWVYNFPLDIHAQVTQMVIK